MMKILKHCNLQFFSWGLLIQLLSAIVLFYVKFKPGVNLVKLLQVQFTNVAIVLDLKIIATLVNCTCKSFTKLTPDGVYRTFTLT